MDKDKRDNVIKLAGTLAKENLSQLKRQKREKQKKWLIPGVALLIVAVVGIGGWLASPRQAAPTYAEPVIAEESAPVPDAELLRHFSAVAVKRLAASEIDPNVSNKHEFHGIKSFQNVFGEEKQRFRARFVYFGTKTFSSDTEVTWYGFPVGKNKEKIMYQLYYKENPVTREAKAGDALFVAKYSNDQLMAIVAQQGSDVERQLFSLFGIEPDYITRSGLNIKDGGSGISVKTVLADQLQQTGKMPIQVDIWKDVETGEISISGRVDKVKDGDTLTLSEVFDVRLIGIDTPEQKQTCKMNGKEWACGAEAKRYLESLVAGKEIRCTNKKKEKYGRFLSVCEVGGININEEMIRKGLAVVYYSDMFEKAEKEARLNEVGLWGSEFINPEEWRRGVR